MSLSARTAGTYQRAGCALLTGMTDLSPPDRRAAWETARDEAHLAFRLWCEAPYGAKRERWVTTFFRTCRKAISDDAGARS